MKGTQDIFYRKIKSAKESLPPIFVSESRVFRGVSKIFFLSDGSISIQHPTIIMYIFCDLTSIYTRCLCKRVINTVVHV